MSVTLTLRVTGSKRRPGTKPSSVQEENICHIINKLRPLACDKDGGNAFLDDLEKAADLKSQLDKLKKGCKSIHCEQEDKETQDKFYFTVLVEILLYLELKSPLRSGVTRILKDYSSGKKSADIKNIIANSLTSRYNGCGKNVSTIITVSNSLCGCFDNFPVGVGGVEACRQETLIFIVENLMYCKQLLSASIEDVSTEVCQCTHILVRAALHVSSLTTTLDLTQLHGLASDLVAFVQLPLDVRTNCGLLAVVTGRHHWLEMLGNQLISDDNVTSLCIYSGVIGSLSVEELSAPANFGSEGKTALQIMFDSIMDIHLKHPLHPTVTLNVARILVSFSRALLPHGWALPPFLPRLLDYCWEHLEHHMDSVKHLTSSLLINLSKMHSTEVDVNGAILRAIKSLPMQSRARHTALCTLVGKVPVSLLVSGSEDISLLYQQLNQELISSHAVNAFQELLKHHYHEEEDKEKWKELWIRPLLHYLDHNQQSVPLQQVLSRAVAVCSDIVPYVMSLPDGDVSLGTRLLCLCHAHKQGQLAEMQDADCKWKGLVDYHLLTSAIHHINDQTRLSCLSLIVESPKSTEVFTNQELKLIKDYVLHNLNFELPASRQRSIALLGKFVCRLDESRQVLERHSQQSGGLQAYADCRLWLERCCLDSLFPGAAYSRRTSALHLLSSLGISLVEPNTTTTLLACLADSYEDLKQVAMRLLISTPGLLQQFDAPQTAVAIIEESLNQAGGVKPPECLTAAYLLATFSYVPLSQETLTAIINKNQCCMTLEYDYGIEYRTVYCCLLIVLQSLTQQLRVAEASVLKAASSGPLYGLLFTAKLLLSQVNLSQCTSSAWRELITVLVDVSFQCSQAVASVVNSDSPEGHLPMDFDFDPMEVYGKGSEEEEGGHRVTSQMVLLCSWRTVKEVSLLLGFLAEEATIALSPEDEGLLLSEDILRIGDHLTTLLAETKHRGAFEQAYVGFCKLVSRLWRLPSGHLKELPQQWLEDTIQEVCRDSDSLCATRRSAGIPFMIQALISTQLEIKGPSSLEPWVTQLLDVAESPTMSPMAHTHALNILRALVRSTQLGETIGVFVERAVIASISSFTAASWMERNSATLLLSALMTRVFGVPRSKSQDNLGWKNKMTGRIFFQRYPKLFGFFQDELKKASHFIGANIHPTLYPVLLILGRLYPSSLEGTDSNLKLTQFIPDIQVCAGSNIYKTRTLAASAVVALMSATHLDNLINKISDNRISRNLRHGLLLQVANYLKHSEPKADQELLKNKAEIWVTQLLTLVKTKISSIELEALFQVLNIFSEKYFNLVSDSLWTNIINFSKAVLKVTQDSNKIALCLLRPTMCELLLKIMVLRGCSELPSLCCELLVDKMCEVKHTVLDFISCLISDTHCSQRFCLFFNNIPSNIHTYCKTVVLEHFNGECSVKLVFVQIVLDMLLLSSKNCYSSEEKSQILMVLMKWKSAFNKVIQYSNTYTELDRVFFLVNLCRDSHKHIAMNAAFCLLEFMSLKKEIRWLEEDLEAVSELLMYFNQPEVRETFSSVAHDLVTEQFEVLQQTQNPINRLQNYKLYIELSPFSEWPLAVDRVCHSEINAQVTAALLTALTLGHLYTNLPEVTGCVFEKEEVNDAYEEYILSKICSQRLNALPKDLMDCSLSTDVSKWLEAETGVRGISLTDIVTLAKLRTLTLEQNIPSQFLRPNYQRLRLNSLKIKNIL